MLVAMQKIPQWNLWYLLLAVLGMLLIQDLTQSWRSTEPLPYSELMVQLEAGNVASVVVYPDRLQGEFKQATGK